MISNTFGNTKPVNFIILLSFLFLFYWTLHLGLFQKRYGLEEFALQLCVCAVLLFSIFVVDFIVKRNQITGTNAFTMLYFTMLIVVFPEVLMDNNGILSTFFLLLALRRLISLKSLKSIKLKLFDATLWIGVASLFYDWALLFVILVFVGIYFYEPKNFKNWLVPLIALFTVGAISWGFLILVGYTDFLTSHYRFSVNFETDYFGSWGNLAKLIGYTVCTILAGLFAFVRLGKLGLGRIITMRLVAIALILGLVVTVLKTGQDTYPILLTFFPASVLLTKYVEVIKKVNLQEIVLISSVLLPFIIFLAGLISK
ncbi:DUF6427 family protein [Poritiphilus flavus]|uniref:Uncharacterized protein n=1 Tax=Poritiphilus flavus TaxID=2697053 RepID=A0A6L9E8I6_9FLAO|nr:DUF6427 family protein [Poritiphilus flavus]NAS10964.1 hypothetical protein [Poritiphilus flavus]